MQVIDSLLKAISIIIPFFKIKKGSSVYTGITDADTNYIQSDKCKYKTLALRDLKGKKISRLTKKYHIVEPYNDFEINCIHKKDNEIYYTLRSVLTGNIVEVNKEDFLKYFKPTNLRVENNEC